MCLRAEPVTLITLASPFTRMKAQAKIATQRTLASARTKPARSETTTRAGRLSDDPFMEASLPSVTASDGATLPRVGPASSINENERGPDATRVAPGPPLTRRLDGRSGLLLRDLVDRLGDLRQFAVGHLAVMEHLTHLFDELIGLLGRGGRGVVA